MMTDPAQQLTDAGRRVLETVRPLVAAPKLGWFPETYEGLLLDPMELLFDTCGKLLERPDATEPDGSLGKPEAPLSPFLHPGARATGASEGRHDPHVSLWREYPPTGRLDVSARDQVLRAIETPFAPLLNDQDRDSDLPETPSVARPEGMPPGSGKDDPPGSDGLSGEHSSRGHEETRRPAQGGRPKEGQTELPPGAPARAAEYAIWDDGRVEASSSVPASPGPGLQGSPGQEHLPGSVGWYPETSPGDHSPARISPERPASWHEDEQTQGLPRTETTGANRRDDVWLTADPSRFAAMLREHVADTEGSLKTRGGARAFPSSRQEADGRAAGRDRMLSDNRIGVEEVMERLMEQLETEFVRTYGSSGWR